MGCGCTEGANLRLLTATYSLHCSSFFWFNQFYIKDPKEVTPKRNYNGDYRLGFRVYFWGLGLWGVRVYM